MRSSSVRLLAVTVAMTVLWPIPARAQAPTTVVIVRHAERASDTDRDPVLSEAGSERARALAEAMRLAPPGVIIVTQYRRTALTAQPVAYENALAPITVVTEPDIAAHARKVAAAVRKQGAGKVVLVVGHSDSVGEIIRALGGPAIQPLCTGSYDDLFVLTMLNDSTPQLLHARYGHEASDTSCLADRDR